MIYIRLLKSRCPTEQVGRCHCRHLADCHPERIALLYQYGQITSFEANAWRLTPGNPKDVNVNVNPFAGPFAKKCDEFETTGICKRNREGKICRLLHIKSTI